VLSGNQTVRAVASKTGFGDSDVQTTVYDLWIPESTIVTTIAGNGVAGWTDGPAGVAQFNSPQGICVDAGGTVYVTDTGNNVIRSIDTKGIVATLAGDGNPGFRNGTGSNAQFNVPLGICVGQGGDIFVADRQNRRIRRITPGGVVTTFSGSGATGNDDGPPESASFAYISHMSADAAGNLYVGSEGVIRRIAANGSVASTAISVVTLTYDPSLVVDPANNFYIVSSFIYVDKMTPRISDTIYAGSGVGFADGPRLQAKLPQYFFFNRSIVLDTNGSLCISDPARIRKLSPDGFVSTLAGSGLGGYRNGVGASASFNNPSGLALDLDQNLLVADAGNHRIRKIWIDTAGRGIPDAWQQAHFGHVGIDPNTDPDHDGMSNLAEFWAGTDPLDSNSVFALKSCGVSPDGHATITWPSVTGRVYTVEFSDDFARWTPLGAPLPGNGSVMTVSDPASMQQAPRRVYRVYVNF
jgi:hypothetical protein